MVFFNPRSQLGSSKMGVQVKVSGRERGLFLFNLKFSSTLGTHYKLQACIDGSCAVCCISLSF